MSEVLEDNKPFMILDKIRRLAFTDQNISKDQARFLDLTLSASLDIALDLDIWDVEINFFNDVLSSAEMLLPPRDKFRLLKILDHKISNNGSNHYWIRAELRKIYLNRYMIEDESSTDIVLFSSNNITLTLSPNAQKLTINKNHPVGQNSIFDNCSMFFDLEKLDLTIPHLPRKHKESLDLADLLIY